MITVKLDRATDSTHIVEDGETVRYDPEHVEVLEVLNVDDEPIAVFRGWVYARPTVDEDYDNVGEDDDFEVTHVEDVMIPEAFLQNLPDSGPLILNGEAPGTVSSGHANSHGAYGLADDETEGSAE